MSEDLRDTKIIPIIKFYNILDLVRNDVLYVKITLLEALTYQCFYNQTQA